MTFRFIFVIIYKNIFILGLCLFMKLLAIDGNSIINRAFYGVRLLSTKDGRFTNAVYGFINILLKLRESEKPDGIVVAFDVKKPTFRHEKYAEYKAGRHATPPELLEQFAPVKEWLRLMGYKVIECPGFEADDILGTIAEMCEKGGIDCAIATGDRDALQLIGERVRVVLATTKMGGPETTNYDKAALFERYRLTPEQMIELKALMGDSSDNIPGVQGVGEKTATELITKFGNIDYIYEHLDEIDIKAGVKAKLELGKENAFFSRWLGTICRTSPIDTNPESYLSSECDEAGVAALMTELELFKLMERLGINPATAKTVKCAECVSAEVISDFEFLIRDLKRIDIVKNGDGFTAFDGECCAVLSREQGLSVIADKNIEKRVYDAKNLYKECVAEGVTPENIVFDAMLAGYLSNPSSNSYAIERLAAEYGAAEVDVSGDCENVRSALLLSSVCDALEKELVASGQTELLRDIELPLAAVLGDMELSGVLIDADALEVHGKELEVRVRDLEKEIHDLVGYEFNLNSPKQLGVALFEKLQLPAKKKTKSGYSTNAEVLEELRDEHPAVSLLLQYRTLAKLKSTYCDSLLEAVALDGRIHSTFNQTETRTGRISSLEPNLQNIPVKTEEGRVFRKFFIAKKGYTLVDADYSQIELRVLAHMANDKVMLDAFNSGADIHTRTAAEVFSLPEDMITPVLRSRAKAVNFGIVYGIGAFSLAKDIGVSNKEAKQYIENYLATFRGVDLFMQKTIEGAKENGYVTTVFGRRRYLPEITSSNGMMRAFGERVARNAPIQGTAADIIKIAMINVFKRLRDEKLDAKLILQVHDELIIECAENIKDTVSALLREEMENAVRMSLPLTADVHSGYSWYEAKD